MKSLYRLTLIPSLIYAVAPSILQATLQIQDIHESSSLEPRQKIQKLMPTLNSADLNTVLATAQHLIGIKYRQGIDQEKDLELAFTFIKSSAELNYPPAQYDLYVMYKQGIGIKADLKQAIEWCQKAARLQHPAAENDLGMMYELGYEHLTANKEMAIEYYKKALEHNYALALENLERI